MKKFLILILLIFGSVSHTNAMMSVFDIETDSNNLTFTLDGDMTEYHRPIFFTNMLFITFSNELVDSTDTMFDITLTPIFDNKTIKNSCFWDTPSDLHVLGLRFDESLLDADVDDLIVTLSLSNRNFTFDNGGDITIFWGMPLDFDGNINYDSIIVNIHINPVPIPDTGILLVFGLIVLLISTKKSISYI